MYRIIYLFILMQAFFVTRCVAQEFNTTVAKDIVILHSTKDYNAALKTAQDAAKRLGKKLDLESNHPHKQLGLSMTKADCAGNGYDYPCYTARGDGNAANSDYISVEYSDAYEGFAKGYYIVVAGVATPNSAALQNTVTIARKWYKDAYAKRTHIWFGCMH